MEAQSDNKDTSSHAPAQNNADARQKAVHNPSPAPISKINEVHQQRGNRNYHKMGSQTGITEESHVVAASLLGRFPWYIQLIIPGQMIIFTYLLRWGSLLYVPTSIAEMLLSGLELVASAIASQWIRKRQVSRIRWMGVGIVTVGLVIIGVSDITSAKDHGKEDNEVNAFGGGAQARIFGMVLIAGSALLATALALTEEILTQEAGYPVLIVMGNEGLWGLVTATIFYFPLANPLFDENRLETRQILQNSPLKILYCVGLTMLFTLAGMINIFAVAYTSSMTRNTWQHLRAIPAWIISLVIHYSASGADDLGEPWLLPHSLFVLLGFAVMLSGVFAYYRKQESTGGE